MSKGNLWRIILAVGGAIGLAQAIGLSCCGQESPRWIAENGNVERARRVLRTIRGDGDIDAEVASWGVPNVDAVRLPDLRNLALRCTSAQGARAAALY